MNRLKGYWPIGLLGVCSLVALVLTINSQWLFGGYEGLLYTGLKPLIEGDDLLIDGQLHFSPSGGSPIGNLLTMTISLAGEMNTTEGTGRVDITMKEATEGEGPSLGALILEDGSLWLVAKDLEGDPLNLKDLLPVTSGQNLSQWRSIYKHLVIEEGQVYDPRPNQGHLKKNVVNYHLDLRSLLTESQRLQLLESLNMKGQSLGAMGIDIQVDGSGDLLALRLNLNSGEFHVEGWMTLLSPPK